MKKLLIVAIILAVLVGCKSTTDTAEITKLKREYKSLKQVQRKIAIKVGLANLVRPEAITLSDEGIKIGSDKANIVMLEYTDLHCPYCKTFQKTVWPEFKKLFVDTNKVMVIARDFPLVNLHPKAPFAAVMLQCAAKQGQYTKVKEVLFEIGSELQEKDINTVISEHNLDSKKYKDCLANVTIHNKVSRSTQEGRELGLSATPAFIIGRKQGDTITDYEIVTGAKPLSYFTTVINRLKENN